MKGACITGVRPRSPAARAGLRAGETLLSINGQPIGDVLDYRFYSYDARLIVQTDVRRVVVRHQAGEDLGLDFDSLLMDGEKRCRNRCVFCFVDQQPPGLRASLYMKDDDARLSFMRGQYITLTNLCKADLERILRMRISPLRVSVHTTDPALRVKMLGNPHAGEQSLSFLRRLAEEGIAIHAQIVVCPGLNDGEALRRTLADLTALAAESIAVVPVGLTRYREGLHPLRPVGKEEAEAILAIADEFSACACGTDEPSMGACGADEFSACARGTDEPSMGVFCADELFIKAGRPIPPACYYGDYPQLENGVGLLRLFASEWQPEPPPPDAEAFSVATGVAAAPFVREWLKAYPAMVYAVENRFWGESVTVAGLLTGGDLRDALRGKPLGKALLIPTSMLRHGGDMFLDGMTPRQLQDELGVPVIPVEPAGAALGQALLSLLGEKDNA